MVRIIKRKFVGGPLDGRERLLNADIIDYREIELKSAQGVGCKYHISKYGDLVPDIPSLHVEHLYRLSADSEFHYMCSAEPV
jgi:hypothetical protein